MVQRKTANRLVTFQSDHPIKPQKLSVNFKPSFHLQDSKTKGREMKNKKKMTNKTRTLTLSDFESFKSMAARKPPTGEEANTPQKQTALARVTNGSPNYMKGTNSSEARIESLLQINSKIFHRRNQNGSASGGTQTRNSTRTSSLQIVRTLTKTPSFKKSSRIVICTDMNAQRATCSSVLKDSKFPEYLSLNPGHTESNGTSVLKVCPYTYCSLNGDLRKQLTPLKSFISSRRRALKNQRRVSQENDEKQIVVDDRISDNGIDTSHLMPGKGMDCFVEIYVKNKDEIFDCQEAEEKSIDVQVSESLSDGPPSSQIDSREIFGQDNNIFSNHIDEKEIFPEKDGGEENYRNGSEIVVQAFEGSEITHMEWEETEFFSSISEVDISESVGNFSNFFEEDEMRPNPRILELSDPSVEGAATEEERKDPNAESKVIIVEIQTNIALAQENNASEKYFQLVNTATSKLSLYNIQEFDYKTDETSSREFQNQEQPETCDSQKWTTKRNKTLEDESAVSRTFNPREPNYLPVVLEPDSEKVDLKHQETDERKNAEEWMVDCALQRAVMKLGPARKCKVALLVEAFEAVMPAAKCQTHASPPTSAAVDHGRILQLQACN